MRPEKDNRRSSNLRKPYCVGRYLKGTMLLWCLLIVLGDASNVFAAAEILRIRYFSAPEYTRIVLDLSEPASFDVRRVANPERVAINVARARFRGSDPISVEDGLVKRIRRNASSRRAQVVLDLVTGAEVTSFSLPAASGRADRIVVDVQRPANSVRTEPVAVKPELETRPFTVVIDPGHGGLDPGAIRNGVREKDVVLDVSKEIVRLINARPGYRAVLTRSSDYYPSLARRVEIAGEKDGDLFLSIHCNTHPKRSVSGMFVYFLSLQGATDREAQELADKENAADLVGVAPGEHHSDSVMSILMDLRMTQVLHESSALAQSILGAAAQSGVVNAQRAKQARFQVLRSLAMPSALVELAYLSNAKDRKVLNSREGRRQLAAMVVDGIAAYHGDPDAIARIGAGDRWTKRYKVRRGDSLWKLARRNGTTVAEITRKNALRESSLRIGQWLTLPSGGGQP